MRVGAADKVIHVYHHIKVLWIASLYSHRTYALGWFLSQNIQARSSLRVGAADEAIHVYQYLKVFWIASLRSQ